MRMCGEGVGKFSSTGGSAQARPDLLGAASRRLGAPEPHPSTGMTEGLATQSEVARFAGVDPQLVRQSPQIPSRGDYGAALRRRIRKAQAGSSPTTQSFIPAADAVDDGERPAPLKREPCTSSGIPVSRLTYRRGCEAVLTIRRSAASTRSCARSKSATVYCRGSGRVRFLRRPFDALLARMAALTCFEDAAFQWTHGRRRRTVNGR
jgi:hypothetical protein